MTVDYRQSLNTALSCWLATLAAFALHLDNPWWATISAWVIATPDKSALWQKATLRICGTILGCLLGYQAAAFLVAKPGRQAIYFFLLGSGAVYMRYRSKFGYAWLIGGVAALLLMANSLNAPETLYIFAYYRAYEIACGVFSALISDILFTFLRKNRDVPRRADSKPAKPASGGFNHNQLLNAALIGGLTSVVIPLLWSWFDLPSLPQTLVTVLVLIDPNLDAFRSKGIQRMIGCFVGGFIGLLGTLVTVESLMLWSAIFVLGIACFARLHLSDHPWAYAGTQAGFAFIMALVTGYGPPDSIVPVVNRLFGVVVGLLVLMMVTSMVRFCQSGNLSARVGVPVS